MAQFVQHNQKRKAQNELTGFDEYFHGVEGQKLHLRLVRGHF